MKLILYITEFALKSFIDGKSKRICGKTYNDSIHSIKIEIDLLKLNIKSVSSLPDCYYEVEADRINVK